MKTAYPTTPWVSPKEDPSCVYTLGRDGCNRFWFKVYGHPETPSSELEAVARVAKAAPLLAEALFKLRDTLNRNGYATSHADAALRAAGVEVGE